MARGKANGETGKLKMDRRVCPCCGKDKITIREFYGNESLLYSKDKRHLVCKTCMSNRYNYFLAKCDNDELVALRRTCDNFDIVFEPNVVNKVVNKKGSLFVNYMKEITSNSILRGLNSLDSPMFEEMKQAPDFTKLEIDENVTLKWGIGFEQSEYQQLEYWYHEYMEEYKPKDLSTKKILKDLCMTELLRERARLRDDDKAFDMYTKSLSKSRQDANIQPSQNKNDDEEKRIFGLKMKIYEQKYPVIKRLKQYADVDGFEKYMMKHVFKPLAVALGLAVGNYSFEDGDEDIKFDEKLEQALANLEEDQAKERNGDSNE